jgi:hypothetical protein
MEGSSVINAVKLSMDASVGGVESPFRGPGCMFSSISNDPVLYPYSSYVLIHSLLPENKTKERLRIGWTVLKNKELKQYEESCI